MADLSLPKRLLHWYAIFVAASVVVLICSGGLVTSHGAGMAVPDWPNSFGNKMFFSRLLLGWGCFFRTFFPSYRQPGRLVNYRALCADSDRRETPVGKMACWF